MKSISNGSFCNDSSCAYFRSHEMIYDVSMGNRNFFSFRYISC